MTLKDYILKNRDNNRIAVSDSNGAITYKELFQSTRFVASLILEKIPKRSHIAILLPNSKEYVMAYYSILLSDCVVVPIYYMSSESEIEFTVNYCDVAAIITDCDGREKISPIQFSNKVYVLELPENKSSIVGETKKDPSAMSPADTAIIIGTSGSTSNPKRVMLSHNNLISNASSIIKSLEYDENEKFLCVLPLTFSSGNTSQLVVSLMLSASLYIYQGPLHPRIFFSEIEKNEITSVTVVPSVLQVLNVGKCEYVDCCKTLKTFCFGGAPANLSIYDEIMKSKISDKFVYIYGQTENSPRISHLHLENEVHKFPSVGKPLEDIEVSISTIDAEEKIGEILLKGNSVMLGYYKQSQSPIKDGWLETGDLGFVDEDGYIYIAGRRKNIIIYSGINIYPEEVETVICSHPSVSGALVYGEPSVQYGEIPVADVVLATTNNVTEEEIKKVCLDKLTKYKIPHKVNFVRKLSYTKNGKINRKGRKTDE